MSTKSTYHIVLVRYNVRNFSSNKNHRRRWKSVWSEFHAMWLVMWNSSCFFRVFSSFVWIYDVYNSEKATIMIQLGRFFFLRRSICAHVCECASHYYWYDDFFPSSPLWRTCKQHPKKKCVHVIFHLCIIARNVDNGIHTAFGVIQPLNEYANEFWLPKKKRTRKYRLRLTPSGFVLLLKNGRYKCRH